MGHKAGVKISPQQRQWLEYAVAGPGGLAWLALSGNLSQAPAWLALGAAWLALAWTHGLSPLLVVVLTGLAREMPGVAGLPVNLIWASALGVAAWSVSAAGHNRAWGAAGAGMLWGGAGGWIPGILPLCLAGFPRLGRIHSGCPGWVRWPGLGVLAGGWAAWIWFSGVPEAAFRVREAAHYRAWAAEAAALFGSLTLWTVLPLAGVFEFAQKQPEDLRTTWRNLPVLGMGACVLFLDAETGVGLFYLNAMPLTALMLTRWSLALRSWIPRGLLWAGLAAQAWGLLAGGSV